MALREIRVMGDEILAKPCREVKEMTPKYKQLVDDMLETMYEANGVGLAAPQVGILRRIAVIDIGDGPVILVNPRLLESEGENVADEGCLSLPGKAAEVPRPDYVKVLAFDENMQERVIEGEELLARALCHEIEHLDGHMYVEKAVGPLHDVEFEEE